MFLYLVSLLIIFLLSYLIINKHGFHDSFENYIAFIVLSFCQIIFITISISIFSKLDRISFLILHFFVLAISAPFLFSNFDKSKWQPSLSFKKKNDRILLILFSIVLFFLSLNVFLILYVPPNTVDSMTYHLARIGYWMQHHSLDHFKTSNLRQTDFPFNAEILMMHSVLFLKNDLMVGFVQFTSYIGSSILVYLMARCLAFSKYASAFAAFIFLALPQIALQSTSTQNDLTVAFFIFSSAYFLFKYFSAKSLNYLALSGISIGCAIGMKTYAFFILPSLAILLVFSRPNIKEISKVAAVYLLSFLILGSYSYVLNYKSHKNPFGDAIQISVIRTDYKLSTFKSNLFKTLFDLIDFYPLYSELTHDRSITNSLSSMREALISKAIHKIGIDEKSGFFTYKNNTRHTTDEDYTRFGILGFFLLPMVILICFFGESKEMKIYAMISIVYFLVFTFFIQWQPFLQRFLISFVIFCIPLMSFIYSNRISFFIVSLISIMSLATVSLFNEQKPIFAFNDRKSIFEMSKNEMRLIENHKQFYQIVSGGKKIGLKVLGNYYEYPIFGRHFENKLFHISLDQDISEFDYIIIQDYWNIKSSKRNNDSLNFIEKNNLIETPMNGLYLIPKPVTSRVTCKSFFQPVS